jgi:hypothetical protein
MKKGFPSFLAAGFLLASPIIAVAQQAPPSPNSLPGAQYGPVSNWGCEVLVCLSDRRGPMTETACRQPIQRLYRALFRWRPQPFPVCIMASGSDARTTGNYAEVGPPSYYDACPAGTTALPQGQVAMYAPVQTTGPVQVSTAAPAMTPVVGIGEGAGYYPGMGGENGVAMPQKVCVGASTGTTTYTTGAGDNSDTFTVPTYSNIALIDPAGDTFTINVYTNGQLFRTIRPVIQ